ncbi:hypothetical protein BDZ89DRAFT_777918 [Hymenopellis radicata]|nr:hypothetical protein BDZ89DRAFT_777918 [Hymenopellis radicata]
MYLHGHHPSQTPPQHQHMPLPSPYPMYPQPHPHQFDYNQPNQPYMYWNGYGPSGSGSHTPEYVGYPYAQPPPFQPHSRAEFIPVSQHSEQPTAMNGNTSTHPPISSSASAVKPPRPEDSDAVTGPALERGPDDINNRKKVIFGSIGLPGSSKAPSPAPPSSTTVSAVEKTFSGFSIGIPDTKKKEPVVIDLTESTPKWEFGTTNTADAPEMGDTQEASQEKEVPQLYASASSSSPHSPAPQHPPLAPLHIPQYFSAPPPFSNYIPNGETENHAPVYQPPIHPTHYAQHQPALSMSSARSEIPPYDPNAEEDAELTVRDFGFGFGAVSGSGYAVSLAREEQGRRQRERERERDQETQDIVNGGPEMWGQDEKREEPLSSVSIHSGSPQERSFFPIRGKRGHYGGYSDRGGYERRGGRGRGFGRGRGIRGGGFHRGFGAYSPQQQHYAPQFAGAEGVRYGEAYYGGHMYAPPHFPAGYYDYDVGGYRPTPPQEESPVTMPSIHHPNGVPPQNPNMPPLPTPITQLSFPLDATRYYVLGQVEYYLSMQNMAQDLFLRKRMDPQGWISISLLATFNRVKQLTGGENVDLVREVLELSSVVEMHSSRESVRMYDWERYVLPPEAKDNGSSSTKTSSEMAASPVTPGDTYLEHEHEHEEGKEEDEEEDDVVFVLGGEAGYVDVRS